MEENTMNDVQEPVEAETTDVSSDVEQTTVTETVEAESASEKMENHETVEAEEGADKKAVPYKRFKEVIGEKNSLETEIENLRKEVNSLKSTEVKKAVDTSTNSGDKVDKVVSILQNADPKDYDSIINQSGVTAGEYLAITNKLNRIESEKVQRERELLEAQKEIPLLNESWFASAVKDVVQSAAANGRTVSLKEASTHVMQWVNEAKNSVKKEIQDSQISRTKATVSHTSGKGMGMKSTSSKIEEAKKTGNWTDVLKDRVKLSFE